MGDPMLTLFTRALGLAGPWQVAQVHFEPAAHEIHFDVACIAKRLPCPHRKRQPCRWRQRQPRTSATTLDTHESEFSDTALAMVLTEKRGQSAISDFSVRQASRFPIGAPD